MISSTPLNAEYFGTFKYTNYTIDDIKNLKVKTCKTDSDCPELSNGCELYTRWDGIEDKEYHLCDMTYMCHENSTCLLLHNTSTYYINIQEIEYGITFINNNTLEHKEVQNNDKIILHSCDKSMYKHNLCKTDTCLNSSNCYSNLCYHDTCIRNKDYPSYICRIDWSEEKGEPIMSCKYANGEKCSISSDCDQFNVCDDLYEVCTYPMIAESHHKNKFPDYVFFFGVSMTVIIVIALVVLSSLFVMSCIYVAIDELKNILFNITDDYRQLESTN
jgi:hypothetical protein